MVENVTTQPYQSSSDDRINWILAHAFSNIQGKSAIDLGCGTGFVCRELSHLGAATAIGCDIVDASELADSWRFAKCDLSRENWVETLKESQSTNQTFDLITAFDILEHLHNPVSFLEQCRELCHKDTRLVLTTPNTGSWERWLKPTTWSGATDPQHFILYNKYSLSFLLQKCGFALERLEAPIRALGPLNSIFPDIGGQLMACARLK